MVVLVDLGHQSTRVGRDIHELILLTEVGHRALALAKTDLQHAQLLIDKLNGLICHHVLALHAVQEVDIREFVDEVTVALRRYTHQLNTQDGTAVGDEIELQTAGELIGQSITRTETEIDMLPRTHHNIRRINGRLKELRSEWHTILRSVMELEILCLGDRDAEQAIILYLTLIQVVIRHRVYMRIFHHDRRVAVDITRLEATLRDILHIEEWQGVYGTRNEVITTENDQLVVDIAIARLHTKTLHEGRIAIATSLRFLDNHRTCSEVGLHHLTVLQVRQ